MASICLEISGVINTKQQEASWANGLPAAQARAPMHGIKLLVTPCSKTEGGCHVSRAGWTWAVITPAVWVSDGQVRRFLLESRMSAARVPRHRITLGRSSAEQVSILRPNSSAAACVGRAEVSDRSSYSKHAPLAQRHDLTCASSSDTFLFSTRSLLLPTINTSTVDDACLRTSLEGPLTERRDVMNVDSLR